MKILVSSSKRPGWIVYRPGCFKSYTASTSEAPPEVVSPAFTASGGADEIFLPAMSISAWFSRRLVERGAQASPFQRRRHEDSHCYIDVGGWIDGFGICGGALSAGDECYGGVREAEGAGGRVAGRHQHGQDRSHVRADSRRQCAAGAGEPRLGAQHGYGLLSGWWPAGADALLRTGE